MVNFPEVQTVGKTMGPSAKQKKPSDHSAHKVPVDLSNARIGQHSAAVAGRRPKTLSLPHISAHCCTCAMLYSEQSLLLTSGIKSSITFD